MLLLSITQPTQYTPRILRLNNKDHKSSYHRPPLSNTNGLDPKDLQKAAFVVLARNSDLYSFLPSMRAVCVFTAASKRHLTPPKARTDSIASLAVSGVRGDEAVQLTCFLDEWVFLNDKPFNDEFKACVKVLQRKCAHLWLTNSTVTHRHSLVHIVTTVLSPVITGISLASSTRL